ncbi:MAG TPA: rod shape-determining protein RodA [Gemmatimonadales bacterium]|nr:rod shape-determining protein RodA [Gemmatimonadales bacterium]
MLSRVRQLDKALVVSVGLLAFYGLATLYSAGQTDVPTFVATIWQRQLVWLGLSLAVAGLTFRTSPRMLEWATPFVYAIAVFLLVLTLLIGTGAGTAAGSRSWLAIGGHRFGQPAELAKLAVILLLARWLAALRESPATLRDLIVPGLIAGLPCVLVLKQPDLGSAIVFVAILFVMLFWAGTKPSLLLLAASPVIGLVLAVSTVAWGVWIAVLAGLLVWWRPYLWEGLAVMGLNVLGGVLALPFWNRLAPYQQNRLLAFLNPDIDPRAAGWHVIQSRVAVGSGGLLGKGFTEGTQKRLAFLPAQHTDFIFSIVGEELGFVGVLIALILFAWLLFVLLRIARRATDPFSSLCVFGVAGLFFTHIVENVGMTINLMPITGIPLPFFSYGGSFLLVCSTGVAVALRVAWEARQSGYAELGQ